MEKKKVILCVFYLMISGLFLNIFLSAGSSLKFTAEEMLKEKCSRCHDLKRVFNLRKRPEQWKITVNRMQNKMSDRIGIEDAEKINLFLSGSYGIDSQELFNDLCLSCHNRVDKANVFNEIKTKSAWARAIERMRHKFHFLIGVDDADQIYEYWTNPVNNKNLKLKITKRDKQEKVFENKCARCHSIGFLKNKKIKAEDLKRLLIRMQAKSPELINDREFKMIDLYLRYSD